MSADILREAASLMRSRAEAATSGRWVVFDMDSGTPDDDKIGGSHGWWWVWSEDRLPYYGGVLDPDPHAANCNGKPETCCRVVVGTAAITDQSEPEKERADAEHIASWHPTVALAVADSIDAFLDVHKPRRHDRHTTSHYNAVPEHEDIFDYCDETCWEIDHLCNGCGTRECKELGYWLPIATAYLNTT